MSKYLCYFNSQSITINAKTSYEAQRAAALYFGLGRRSWKVSVYLADKVHVAID
jgi:hypothetical protein